MRLLAVVSLVGGLYLAGCSTTGTKATTLTDSELKQMVKDKLAVDAQLDTAIDVSANADKNEVTLKGDVPTEELRGRAIELAKSSRPGVAITDKIDVKPHELARSEYTEDMARQAREQAKSAGEKIGSTLDDAWIHTKIVAKLAGNSQTPARKINVDVVGGVVTLRGGVPSPEAKAEAERITKDIEGVRQIRNLLRVERG